jgi:hypothetical protein
MAYHQGIQRDIRYPSGILMLWVRKLSCIGLHNREIGCIYPVKMQCILPFCKKDPKFPDLFVIFHASPWGFPVSRENVVIGNKHFIFLPMKAFTTIFLLFNYLHVLP